MQDLKMSRAWAMPSRDTFSCKPIGEFVARYRKPSIISIDPFARNLGWPTYTNDLNPDTSAQYHLSAEEFLRLIISKRIRVGLALFDPPYSLRQCKEVYESVGRRVTQEDTQDWIRWTKERDLLDSLLMPGGIVLSFGWNSGGMGRKRGYKLEEVLLVGHGPAHNDTICIAERKGGKR